MHYITFLFFNILAHPYVGVVLMLILTIVLLLFIILNPYSFPVKIKNFTLTWLAAIMYLVLYVVFLMTLRIVNLKEHDLKQLWVNGINQVNKIYNLDSYFKIISVVLILIILFLAWLIITIKLRRFLGHQIWKLFFYYRCIHILNNKYYQFENWCKFFDRYFSFHVVAEYLVWDAFFSTMLRSLFNNKVSIISFTKHIKRILFILLFIILIIECLMREFTIYYTFWYLIFLVIIHTWIQITEIIRNYDKYLLGGVLIKRAYGASVCIYVNLTEAEEEVLKKFVTNYDALAKTGLDMYLEYDKLGLPRHSIEFRKEFKLINEKGVAFEDFLGVEKVESDVNNHVPFYWNDYLEIGFKISDLREIDGKYFVNDPLDPEAGAYYVQLKKAKSDKNW